MLIPEEEHQSHRIIQLVHLLEVRDLIEIADVEHGEIFDTVGDAVEDFVLTHAVGVPVSAEADADETLFFRHYCLVDVPVEVWLGGDV